MAITEHELYQGYRGIVPAPRTSTTALEDHACRVVLEERIRELWGRRAWYARHNGWIVAQRVEDTAELRILVRLARAARRVSQPAVERLDPITVAQGADDWAGDHPGEYPAGVGYHDWQAAP